MAATSRAEQLNQALELMYFGFRGLVDAPDRLLARRGLGRMHHRVLYFIARAPGLSVGDLLERLAITKQKGFVFFKPEGFSTIVHFLDQLTGRDRSG
jgi:hypothetical protein